MKNKGIMVLISIILTMVIYHITYAQEPSYSISTRYGTLTSREDKYELSYKGKRILPKVYFDGSAFTQVMATFKLNNSDVLLIVQAFGVSSAPRFVFVTVTETGARATKSFGTGCDFDEETKAVESGQKIILSLPNCNSKGRTKFVYDNGIVSKNGRPIK